MVSESKVFAPIFPIYFTDLAFLKVNLIRKDQGQEGIQQPFLYPLSPGLLSHVQQTAIIFPTLPSAAAVLMEVLPVALYIPCQIHLQVGFGFLNPIPAWSVSLHSSWVSCPLPCASFYYLTFFFFLKFLNHPCWSSLIIHAGLTPPLLDFPRVGMDQSWPWQIRSLKVNQLFWTFVSRTIIVFFQADPWRGQSLLP